MYTNGNLESHLAALLFLGCAGLVLAALAAALLLFFSRRAWARYPLLIAAAAIVSYAVLLAGFSLFSRDRTLARGEEKHFCELDCHIACSVQEVQRVKSIGGVTANGEFYVVRLRSHFDDSTIAPWRPRQAPLIPVPLRLELVGANGARYQVAAAGQEAWNAVHPPQHTMMDCLRPGESYETTWVFDVPADVPSPRLLLSARGEPSLGLIGNEDSPGHGKTYLGL